MSPGAAERAGYSIRHSAVMLQICWKHLEHRSACDGDPTKCLACAFDEEVMHQVVAHEDEHLSTKR